MSKPIELTLPLPPNRANARQHWRARHRAQEDYRAACNQRVMLRLAPKPPAEPWPRARIEVRLYVWNLNDADNAMARCKWPVDWLVKAGYLTDDCRKGLEWAGIPTQEIDRKNQRIEITLTRIEAAA